VLLRSALLDCDHSVPLPMLLFLLLLLLLLLLVLHVQG
jgi:hypothetical protein